MMDKIEFEAKNEDEVFKIDDLVDVWETSSTKLKNIKKLEMDNRINLCDILFRNKQGSFQVIYNDGYGQIVTAQSKENINVDMDMLGFSKDEFQKDGIELLSKYFDQLSDKELACFDVKVSLNTTRYAKLLKDDSVGDDLENSISITPGAPSVTLKYED